MVGVVEKVTYQSKWGFHPVSKEVCRKLKKLNTALERARRQIGTWRRWERKDPHNRVIRRKIRNSEGQVIGYEAPEPMPEPKLCPAFTKKYQAETYWTKNGYLSNPVMVERVSLANEEYANAYYHARHPVPTPAHVKHLTISEEEIDQLLSLLK